MKEKWYNIELLKEEWDDFRAILKRDEEETKIPWVYEVSDAGDGFIHLEIKCLPSELQYLNELVKEIF